MTPVIVMRKGKNVIEMQSVAEDALQEVVGSQHGAAPSRDAQRQVVDMTVDDDDGVVHDHAERHDEGCQGDGVELKVEDVEQPERDKDGDRHCGGGHGSHLSGHDEHHHEQHRDYSDEQLTQEVVDRVVDHLLLVCNLVDLHVGRQLCLDVVELVVDGRAHARDVHALLVAHGEQQCLGAVDGDILVERGIFVLHLRHIFQSDDVAAQVAVNHRVLHIVDFVEALVDVDGTLVFLVLQASARAGKALSGELLRDGQIADAVLGEACRCRDRWRSAASACP